MYRLTLAVGLLISAVALRARAQEVFVEDGRQAGEASVITIRGENFTLAFQADNRTVSQELLVSNPNFVEEEEYSRERPVDIGSARWQVAVIKDGDFLCSGSVIGAYWVLTAAQCVEDSAQYMVRAGTRYFRSGGQTREVDLVVLHSDYDRRTSAHDIALLRLSRRLSFGRSVQPVALAASDASLPTSFFLSGWNTASRRSGLPYSGLRGIDLRLASKKACAREESYSKRDKKKSKKKQSRKSSKKNKRTKKTKDLLAKSTFCTTSAGRGRCHGDPGSALVHDGIQYGVFSFDNGCSSRHYARMNSDIRKSRQWISRASREYAHKTESVIYKVRSYDDYQW